MANNVDNIIEIFFDSKDQNAIEFLNKIYDLGKDGDISSLFEEPGTDRAWWEKNIGAKWAYVNDVDSPPENGFFYVNITSAWGPVLDLVNHISNCLDNRCRIEHQYIDEMPNFAGCRIIKDGDVVYDFSDEDLHETLEKEKKIRMLAESRSFESEQEEGDWFWDWKWEYVHDLVDPDNFKQ